MLRVRIYSMQSYAFGSSVCLLMSFWGLFYFSLPSAIQLFREQVVPLNFYSIVKFPFHSVLYFIIFFTTPILKFCTVNIPLPLSYLVILFLFYVLLLRITSRYILVAYMKIDICFEFIYWLLFWIFFACLCHFILTLLLPTVFPLNIFYLAFLICFSILWIVTEYWKASTTLSEVCIFIISKSKRLVVRVTFWYRFKLSPTLDFW